MKTRSIIIAALLTVCSAAGVQALDRDAKVITQFAVEQVAYDSMDVTRITVWDESALDFEREWGIVAGLGAGILTGSGEAEKPYIWSAALGTTWYPMSTTSLKLLATAEWVDSGNRFRTVGGTAALEQRFVTKESAVSPFLTASASLSDARVGFSKADPESVKCLILKAGAGCDFIVRTDCTIVFQAWYSDSKSLYDKGKGDFADGLGGSFALKYFTF